MNVCEDGEKHLLLSQVDIFKSLSLHLQLELKVRDLQETVEHLEEVNAKLEQTSHKLGQELQISSMAVRELQDSQDTMAELEKDVGQLKDELRLKEEKFMVQKKVRSRVWKVLVLEFPCIIVVDSRILKMIRKHTSFFIPV